MSASALVLLAIAVSAGAVDLPEVESRGVLRVLAVVTGKNDEFMNASPGPGDPPGFDREVLEGFVQLHKLQLRIVPIDAWDGLIPALEAGKGDLIAGRFTVTDSRRRQIAFTSEVFPTRHVVFTRKPHRVVTTLDELRQERVGTVKGTSMAEAVAEAGVPPVNVDDTIPTGQLPEAVRSGRVSAAVLGIENIMSTQARDPEIQIGMFLGSPGSLAYGLRKQDTRLLSVLNEYIESLRKTPTWSRLVVKYFGQQAPEVLKRARGEPPTRE